MCVVLDGRLVDPGCCRQLGWARSTVAEPAGVGGVGGVEGLGPAGPDLGGGAVVHGGGRVQPDPGMTVVMVVVLEERFAEDAGVFDRAEPVGERRAVLERLECRF